MEDSWQKLMGIDRVSEDVLTSPVFHQKKWIVLPKPQKKFGSLPLSSQGEDWESQTPNDNVKEERSKKTTDNSYIQSEKVYPNDDTTAKVECQDDDFVVYDTTPTKHHKHKRKRIDLLSRSFRSEDGSCKKFKIDDDTITGDISPPALGLESILNEQPSEMKVLPSTSAENTFHPKINKLPRKLMYSNNKISHNNTKITPTDIYNSIIMIDEADLRSSPKKSKMVTFTTTNEFQTVTSLSQESQTNIDLGGPCSSTQIEPSNSSDDSFRNYMFTEIEKECLTVKSEPLKSEFSLSPVEVNRSVADDSFSNYRFTEIEDDYTYIKKINVKFDDSKAGDVNNDKTSCLQLTGISDYIENEHQCKDINFSISQKAKKDKSNGLVFSENSHPSKSHISSKNLDNAKLNKKLLSYSKNFKTNKPSNTQKIEVVISKKEDNDKAVESSQKNNMQITDANKSNLLMCDNLKETNTILNDREDVFNSTTLFPENSFSEVEAGNECYFLTSKDSFSNLNSVSTDEFRKSHYNRANSQQNQNFNEDILNCCPEETVLNKSFSKCNLNTTLTDIMKQMVDCSPFSKNMKRQGKSIQRPYSKRNMCEDFDELNESKSFQTENDELEEKEELHQNNSPSSPNSPESSLSPDIRVSPDRTEELLLTIKSKFNADDSLIYHDESFDFKSLTDTQLQSIKDKQLSLKDENQPYLETSFSLEASPPSEKVNLLSNNYGSFDEISEVEENQAETDGLKLPFEENLKKLRVNKNSDLEPLNSRNILSEKEALLSHNNLGQFDSYFSDNVQEVSNLTRQTKENEFSNENCANTSVVEDKGSVSLKKNPIDNYSPSAKSNSCMFLTAGGKSINVSDDCLKKVRSKYKDILEDSSTTTDHNSLPSTNASNQGNSSDDLNIKSHHFLSNINKECMVSKNESEKLNSLPVNPAKGNSLLFDDSKSHIEKDETTKQTFNCSNKKNLSSPSPLENCPRIYSELDQNSLRDISNEPSGSSTLEISNLGPDKIKNTDPNIPSPFKKPISSITFKKKSCNFMFSTAQGKNVGVSKESLKKIKSIFKDDLACEASDVNNIWESFNRPDTSKKPVVDNNFLLENKKMLHHTDLKSECCGISHKKNTEECISGTLHNKHSTLSSEIMSPSVIQCQAVKFSTASGKNISITDEVLSKIKSKFSDILDDTQVGIDSNDEEGFCENFSVHITGKSEDISKSSSQYDRDNNADYNSKNDLLQNSKSNSHKICNDSHAMIGLIDKQEKAEEYSKQILNSCTGQVMFSTASGKNLNISEETLTKIKSKFSEMLQLSPSKEEFLSTVIDKEDLTSKLYQNSFTSNACPLPDIQSQIFKVPNNSSEKLNDKFQNKLTSDSNTDVQCRRDITKASSSSLSPEESNRIKVSIEPSKDVHISKEAEFRSCESELLEQNQPHSLKVKHSCDDGLVYNYLFPESVLKISKLSEDILKNCNEISYKTSPPHQLMNSKENKSDFLYISDDSSVKQIENLTLLSVTARNKSEAGRAKSSLLCHELSENFTANEESTSLKSKDGHLSENPMANATADFMMFSTAGGKNVHVSEEALAKVKSKFNEILENVSPDEDLASLKSENDRLPKQFPKNTASSNLVMFSTAGGSNVKVFEDALAKVRLKYNEILENVSRDEISASLKSADNHFSMFSTSRGRNENGSEEALDKVRTKLSDFSENSPSVEESAGLESEYEHLVKSPLVCAASSNLFMFSTAGGSNVKVSEDELAKVQSKFCKISENLSSDEVLVSLKSDDNRLPKEHLASVASSNFAMFSTAGGRNVTVSEDALAKVRSKFSEISENVSTDENLGSLKSENDSLPKKSLENTYSSNLVMFSTAAGKNMDLSEDALTKVRTKFSEFLDNSSPVKESISMKSGCEHLPEKTLVSAASSDLVMFSTAGGSNVNVSEEALAKVRSKFIEISANISPDEISAILESDDNHLPKEHLVSAASSDFAMFSTAGGRNVNVSEDALAKVRSKFCEFSENSSPIEESASLKPGLKIVDGINALPRRDFENPENSLTKTDPLFKLQPRFSTPAILNDNLSRSNSIESFERETSFARDILAKMKSKLNIILENSISELDPKDQARVKSKFIVMLDDTLSEFDPIVLDKKKLLEESHFCQAPMDLEEKKPSRGFKPPFNQTKIPAVSKVQLENCTINDKYSKGCDDRNKNDQLYKLSVGSDDLISKKSKSPHSESSHLELQVKKKVCLEPEMTSFNVSTSQNRENFATGAESVEPKPFDGLSSFTQSVHHLVLDNEVNMIEKNITLHRNENKKMISDDDIENKNFIQDKVKTQNVSQECDLSLICEVSDSAAAFMADFTPERSIMSSPSSFFNRKKMKPVNLLGIGFDDVDEEIMVEAESKIVPKSPQNNPVSDTLKANILADDLLKTCPTEILTIRSNQRIIADKIIKEKLINRPSQSPGLYIYLRNSKKFITIANSPLGQELSKVTEDELLQNGVRKDVINVTSTNAADFQFSAETFFGYDECFSDKGFVDLENGFTLIFSDDNKIGLNEISRSFLAHPNVDSSLVAPGWIKNHFRWIVWKLACYERAFPNLLAYRLLTPENVLHQMKYRYDREIDLAQRSALKRILECDDPASRRMVACVADIRKIDQEEGESSFEIEITDGWYSVWACVDPAMINLIKQQKVKIGTKLIFHSAELLNCPEGCDPLELAETVRLKLHTNCTRRVKWNTKMGFTKCPSPLCLSLSSVLHNGGLVGLTSAIICRVYPLLYMSKDSEGKTVIRNAQAENHVNNLKQNTLSSKSEELFEKLLPQVESKYKARSNLKFDRSNIKLIRDPEVLWKMMSNDSDQSEIQALMTPDQLFEVRKYHEMISLKIREEVQALVKEQLEEHLPSQKSKCLLKMRLVDPMSDYNALLTVWNPSEELCQIFAERKCFDFYGLNASGIRDRVLQLSNTNRSIYKENKVFKLSQKFERKITHISEVMSNAASAPFGELDIVGIVIYVKEPEKPWGVTNVYLSDAQENFLMITFWTSLKTFGCEDILKPGAIVACINLHWRQGSGSYVIPSTYANELTCFSSNSNQEYIFKEMQIVKASLDTEGLETFMARRRRQLLLLLKERDLTTKTPTAPLVRGVDSPRVMKRLENLKKYGEASPLPKVPLSSSPEIYKKFRSPKSTNS